MMGTLSTTDYCYVQLQSNYSGFLAKERPRTREGF
jgi:hypothetical protein